MYLFFDTETTGLPRSNDAPATDVNNWPRIVQIAWILTDSEGNEKEHADFIIRPNGFSIPKDAAAIHGITTEIALRDGVPLRKALNSFTASIKIANMLVAHNYEFDQRVLIAEYLREGQDTHLLMSIPSVCTMRASTNYCRLQRSGGCISANISASVRSGDVRACRATPSRNGSRVAMSHTINDAIATAS